VKIHRSPATVMGDESCNRPLLNTFTLVINGKAQQVDWPLSQETCLLWQTNHFFAEKGVFFLFIKH